MGNANGNDYYEGPRAKQNQNVVNLKEFNETWKVYSKNEDNLIKGQ